MAPWVLAAICASAAAFLGMSSYFYFYGDKRLRDEHSAQSRLDDILAPLARGEVEVRSDRKERAPLENLVTGPAGGPRRRGP